MTALDTLLNLLLLAAAMFLCCAWAMGLGIIWVKATRLLKLDGNSLWQGSLMLFIPLALFAGWMMLALNVLDAPMWAAFGVVGAIPVAFGIRPVGAAIGWWKDPGNAF